MRRKRLTFCSFASLLLCVAVCALWVRSYWAADYWFRFPPNPLPDYPEAVGRSIVASELGLIHAHLDPIYPAFDEEIANAGFHVMTPDDVKPPFLSSCFGYAAGVGELGHTSRVIQIPHGAIAGLFAGLPALWLWRCYRDKRFRDHRGCCRRCGYDLRVTPGRCPECGMTTAPAAA